MSQRIGNLSPEELESFFCLSARVFCDYHDPRRGPFRLLYLYSNTPDNELSLFLRAIKLANNLSIQALGIAEGDLGHGYAGFDHSVERLKAFGWSGNVPIVKFDVGGNVNTLSEARALAKYARGVRGDIGIVAPAFHLV